METTSGQLCEDLITLMGQTKAGMIALADDLHLTPIQMFALYAILRGEATMGRVACALHCDASNVTGIVDRLVAQGLVVRHESEQDRRTKTLQLTSKGHDIVQTILSRLPEYVGCHKLSPHERLTLHTAITKMIS